VTVSATDIFAFLDERRTCAIERHEVHATTFGNLRRSLRFIALRLAESTEADGPAVAERLRLLLSEWLTVPIAFDASVVESVLMLGDSMSVEARWGRDVRRAYDDARAAAHAIQNTENPVRVDLHDTIHRLRIEGQTWRIYCHKKARVHFESIFNDEPLPGDCFLHSIKDYRDAFPADVLVKVGPLRSRGWGSAPDAVISAPRFGTLIQIVWSGCSDEDDFGYDPVALASPSVPSPDTQYARNPSIQWTRRTLQIGHDDGDQNGGPAQDELKLFAHAARTRELRSATLVEIDDDHGILYPPQLSVLSFDPDATVEAFALRVPGETLLEGMFVVQPVLADPDLGGLHAADGYYSRIWKEHLRRELSRNPAELVRHLRAAGLDLLHVLSRVKDWCRPPTTVIHAPQQRRHFEILINVLGIENDTPTQTYRREWWQLAWYEIAHSRGEAIQTGLQEHEIVSDELITILGDQVPEIRQAARAQSSFQIQIPSGKSLIGVVRFHVVKAIEEGFLAPENNLRTICDLDTIEQWRE